MFLTRRAALGILGGAAALAQPAARRTIALIDFEVVGTSHPRRRYFRPHGDERTARQVLLEHLKTRPGVAYVVAGEERNVPVDGLRLDPNRMFSREGAERSLRRLNPRAAAAEIAAVLARLDAVRDALIAELLPPPGALMIAMHNNGGSYNVHSEAGISDEAALGDLEHPHEFLLAAAEKDFRRLAEPGYNVLLQFRTPPPDDGSFSRLAARLDRRYVNIEAREGNAAGQKRMLDWVESRLE